MSAASLRLPAASRNRSSPPADTYSGGLPGASNASSVQSPQSGAAAFVPTVTQELHGQWYSRISTVASPAPDRDSSSPPAGP